MTCILWRSVSLFLGCYLLVPKRRSASHHRLDLWPCDGFAEGDCRRGEGSCDELPLRVSLMSRSRTPSGDYVVLNSFPASTYAMTVTKDGFNTETVRLMS